VVLCCCTEKCNASNVDFFDRVRKSTIWLGDRRCERVEIADNNGDGGDGLGFEIMFIGRYGSGQDTLDIYYD
jgi:hypothetical protein